MGDIKALPYAPNRINIQHQTTSLHLFFIYFTPLPVTQGHTASKNFIIVNNELKRKLNEAAKAKFMAPSLNLPGRTTKITHELGQSESRNRFEPNTSRMGQQIASIRARASLFGHIQLQAHQKSKGILAAGKLTFPFSLFLRYQYLSICDAHEGLKFSEGHNL